MLAEERDLLTRVVLVLGLEAEHHPGREAHLAGHQRHRRRVLLTVTHHQVAGQQRRHPVRAVARQGRVLARVDQAVGEPTALGQTTLQGAGDQHRGRRRPGDLTGEQRHGVRHALRLRQAHRGGRGAADLLVARCVRDHDLGGPPGARRHALGQDGRAGRVVVAQRPGQVAGTGPGEGEGLRVPDGRQPHHRQVVHLDLDGVAGAADGGVDALPDPAELPRAVGLLRPGHVPHHTVVGVHGGQAHPRARRQPPHGQERGVVPVLDEPPEPRERGRVVTGVERGDQLLTEHETLLGLPQGRPRQGAGGPSHHEHRRERRHPPG
ncbi:hypothetical protein N869_10705 [Cellulomonas bogoriensis 69B4 = DSM 16987]|uniref:Uncharacterized protein n=1 Tax=Cellulomonas bogoriensis 69B4 = DSM 16987 TaxID=1386082 RepID=A0A0A0BIQ6_9CELL|nr:hypothetical protein N869_10705 [Cellulomonas bogoriensis 69B4 = DSM 16987]